MRGLSLYKIGMARGPLELFALFSVRGSGSRIEFEEVKARERREAHSLELYKQHLDRSVKLLGRLMSSNKRLLS